MYASSGHLHDDSNKKAHTKTNATSVSGDPGNQTPWQSPNSTPKFLIVAGGVDIDLVNVYSIREENCVHIYQEDLQEWLSQVFSTRPMNRDFHPYIAIW